jgi:NADPH2:quinone reductase
MATVSRELALEGYRSAMKAIVCEQFGPVGDLRVVERDSAALGPGDVRVAVTACGVNYVDGLFVQGKYQIKPPVPFVPGMEVVGRVFVNVGLGGYVSEVVVGEARTVLLSDSITDGQAATFTQSYLTGWFALRERAQVQSGQSLLVLGAGGGVGLAAVDIGSSLGMRVIAVASTEEKRQLALSRGAEAVIDSTTEDVKERAKELGGGSVDVLYDPVGGDLGTTCLRAMGDNGAYLVIGFVAGIPSLPANQILLRNRRVIGVDWGGWALRNGDRNEELTAEVLAEISAGRLNPVEPVAYPLDEAARALTDLEERRVAGKAILVP